ncbi:YHS domain-containing protein [Prauserella shujinwangii]|uniref:YHS domain-containing protein n=1 Tax=Prauserella shujinwangii TaxID=1453103 RepID=A0A2T0LL47_9PSEU|nr:YHS domain-containing protein [Prauserella shujinwangii]PRX43681.1 YHS domain-containing protein [Prauserella shujinwangii]
MMFIEVFVPKGALGPEQRHVLGRRLVTDVMQAGDSGAPDEVIEAARSLCHVLFHETDGWYTAGREVQPGDPPPYLLRVSVPESWRDGMAPHVIKVFSALVAEVDSRPERLRAEPVAWVHVLGVPDDGIGAMGGVLGSVELVKLITKAHRESPRSPEGLPPGTGFDPVCGMTVPFEHAAATAEHGGTRYAFCSKGCHEVFAEEHTAA